MEPNQEAANAANIKTAKLTIVLVYIAIATLVVCMAGAIFTAWPVLFPKDSVRTAPVDQEVGVMATGWMPAILLTGAALVVTISLLIVAAKRWKNKNLASQLAATRSDLERENEKTAAALADLKALRTELDNAIKERNQEKGSKDGIYNLYRESEQKLASLTWLKLLAEEQAKDISSYVVAKIVSYPNAGELVLEGKELCVVVGVSIRNESVFEINITDKDMKGSFSDGKTFAEPATILKDQLRGPIEGLKPLNSQLLVLEQPLRQSEAERIRRSLADQTVKIAIGDVRLLISSQNASIPVDPKPLLLNDRGGKIPLSDFKCDTKSLDSADKM
jgi:hypothetical protein